MTRQHRTRPRAKRLLSLYIWHRYLGLAAALFVIVLSGTGLLLNHTEEIGLDAMQVSSTTLLDWYGVHAPRNIIAYRAGTLTVAEAGGRIYLENGPLPHADGPLHGAVEFDDLVVVAAGGRLLLLTASGELVESLDSASGMPAGILAIGVTGAGELAIRAADGTYRTDASFSNWTASGDVDVHWATATTLTERQWQALNSAYRGDGLPLERVLLDIHSGRILGSAGVYLMDGAAILFLLLAVSGVWLWLKRLASARAHRRKPVKRGAVHTDHRA